MRFDTSQQLRLSQQMTLSPRIIQMMEILQLPTLALTERIEAELQSNPVLELTEQEADSESQSDYEDSNTDRGEDALVVDSDNGNSEDFERLADFTDTYGMEQISSDAPLAPKARADERDRKLDALASTPANSQSLNEYLHDQWRFLDIDDDIRQFGELIINQIDDDGYLRTPLDDILMQAPIPAAGEKLSEALVLVQTLDPAGVGAMSLIECMIIQLARLADIQDVSLEIEITTSFLRDIELNRLPHIAQRTGKTIEQVKDALDTLSRLNPRPGLMISGSSAPIIKPDVIVSVDENGIIIASMPDSTTPPLHISQMYRKMIRDRKEDRDTKQFVRKNIRSAQWLIEAIGQRRETIRKVAKEVFERQREFLFTGSESLKPLPMADIADELGVHVATISRAVSGKYVQTPLGIYPLRMFFSGGKTTASGKDVSWNAIRAKLEEIVADEDKNKPLNDDLLAKKLKDCGITIARRTVAKYRNLMKIPSARKRREF